MDKYKNKRKYEPLPKLNQLLLNSLEIQHIQQFANEQLKAFPTLSPFSKKNSPVLKPSQKVNLRFNVFQRTVSQLVDNYQAAGSKKLKNSKSRKVVRIKNELSSVNLKQEQESVFERIDTLLQRRDHRPKFQSQSKKSSVKSKKRNLNSLLLQEVQKSKQRHKVQLEQGEWDCLRLSDQTIKISRSGFAGQVQKIDELQIMGRERMQQLVLNRMYLEQLRSEVSQL